MKCAMRLVRIVARLQSKTLDASSPHTPATTTSLETTVSAHRVLLLECVPPSRKILVVASIVAVDRGGALHAVGTVLTVNDRASSLCRIPFLSEATGWVLWLWRNESVVVVDRSGTGVGSGVCGGTCVGVIDVGGVLVRVGKVGVGVMVLEGVRGCLRR